MHIYCPYAILPTHAQTTTHRIAADAVSVENTGNAIEQHQE